MYLLTLELRGPQGQRLRCVLPCANTELQQWLAASQYAISSDQFRRLIRSNPSLFLMAISRAVDCSGQPIQSLVQLLSRLDHCFREGNGLDTALGHVVDVTTTTDDSFLLDVETRAEFSRFHKSKKPKSIIATLCRFIQSSNKRFLPKSERTSKAKIKKFLLQMFDDQLQLKRAKQPSRAGRRKTKNSTDHSADAAVQSLLKDRQTSQSNFESRLLNAKLAAMKQLAYGASHEINNPLANVATRAHTLLSTESHPDRRFQLAVIHEQAMRAHDMISDMMLFAHPPKLSLKPVNLRFLLSQLIRECEQNTSYVSQSKSSITVKVAPSVDCAFVDPTQLKVALASLIQNAAEAIQHNHGEIEITVSHHKQEIIFTVSDNGIGIDADVQKHLFDPFYSGREAGRGLGFGLSKSWRIAQLHGGSLVHRFDRKEVRTVFELRLPRCV